MSSNPTQLQDGTYLHYATAIDKQAVESLLQPDDRLTRAISNSDKNGLPAITVSPLAGQFLMIQCKLMGAKSVLEIGTLGGYSTIWFAKSGAKVTSIEYNAKHRDVALENTKGLDVDIHLGSALEILPQLAAAGHVYDFVLIDASWEEQWEYFQWALKMTRKNGCIYVDNVVRNIIEDGHIGQGESLLTKIGQEPRVDATLMSTITSNKGKSEEVFDGFVMALVKS